MIKRVWDKLPSGFRQRPFDAYTAIALIAVGFFGLISPSFPEAQNIAIGALLFHIIEIYFIVASSFILAALFIDKTKYPRFDYYGQMYGWAFIAAAGISVMTFLLWSELIMGTGRDPVLLLMFFVFGCVGWSAFVRSVDMWLNINKARKAIR